MQQMVICGLLGFGMVLKGLVFKFAVFGVVWDGLVLRPSLLLFTFLDMTNIGKLEQ